MTTATDYEIIQTSATMIEKGDIILAFGRHGEPVADFVDFGDHPMLVTWKHLSHRGKVSIRYGEGGRTFFRGSDRVIIKRATA